LAPPPLVLVHGPRSPLDGGSRRFADTELLRAAFAEVGVPLEPVELEALGPREQVALMTRTDILLGTHGAGLAMGVYMRPGGLLVALNPTNLHYWEVSLFERFARQAGLGYMDWDEHDPGRAAAGHDGWGQDSVAWRHSFNGASWCEELRVFVAQVTTAWVREAERAAALRGRR
jgi:hypothetical protein